MSFYNPGDIQINAVILTGNKGTVDLTNLVQQITISEDITLPGINAQVVAMDSDDLQAVMPMVGEEILYIDYSTPSLPSFTHSFAVTTMTDANPASNLKIKAYNITGVATEVFAHKSNLIQKHYNTTNDEIVKDIFTSFLGSSKPLITEATKGIQDYIVTNKRPFVAIMDVLKRSVSDQHQSSSFVFFENQRGYNFRTLEDLFSQPTVASFTNNDTTADSIFRVIFRNILGYNLPDQFNTAQKVGAGAFASTVKTLDLQSMLFGTGDVNPDVSSMARGMKNAMSSSAFKNAMQSSGISAFIPKDLFKPDTFIDNMIPQRGAYAAEVDQSRVHVRIFGDSTLTVGDKVNLQIATNSGITGPKLPSDMIAGDYLVTKLISIILPSNRKPRYTQTMECQSAGYASSVG